MFLDHVQPLGVMLMRRPSSCFNLQFLGVTIPSGVSLVTAILARVLSGAHLSGGEGLDHISSLCFQAALCKFRS
jgi:hypothetical protein